MAYENQIEEWCEVKGGDYEVSNKGVVRSLKNNKIHILEQHTSKQGYSYVSICNSYYEGRKVKVHRLVAEAFLENTNDDDYINHLSGKKPDNNVLNLTFCSASENELHSVRTLGKKHMKGEKNPLSKLSDSDIPLIMKRIEEGKTHKKIGIEFGVSDSVISNIRRGTRWSHVDRKVLAKVEHSGSDRTEEEILEIYNKSWSGKDSLAEIGRQHNMHRSSIGDIKNGKRWNSVTHHFGI